MRHLGLLLALVLLAVGAARAAEDAVPPASGVEAPVASRVEPRTGEITSHDVNVGAGAPRNYEIVAKLDKGDLVLIAGTHGDWVRIAPPPGVLVWVAAEYVASDGLVEGNSVNVRSGPALKYNIVCQLTRDDHVVIKETSDKGDWYGIVPPEGAAMYVYAKFVADKGPAELYAEWAPRKAECLALLASAEHLRAYELKRDEAQIRFDAILEGYRRIEADYADMPEARVAKRRILEIERLRDSVQNKLAAGGTGETAQGGSETPAGTSSGSQGEEAPKFLTATGVLREISHESSKKGLYRITKEDRWVCIVTSGTLDLAAYAGKTIQVWGVEAPSEGWSLRTITVSRIKLME
jgi:SH3-like domain-containing protein